jgi:hypothetical protein
VKSSNDLGYEIYVVGDWLYFLNYSDNGQLYKMKTDGTNKAKVNEDGFHCVNVVGDWIYYASQSINNPSEQRMFKIKTDGSGKVEICDDQDRWHREGQVK